MCTSLNGVAVAALLQPRNDELTTNYSQKATKASFKLYASILKFILYLFILNIVLMGMVTIVAICYHLKSLKLI